MEPITGVVQSITLNPGRADVILVMFEGGAGVSHAMNLLEGEVTCDDKRTDPTEFFKFYISKYPIKATLYPCVERYGVAMKAEFTAENTNNHD